MAKAASANTSTTTPTTASPTAPVMAAADGPSDFAFSFEWWGKKADILRLANENASEDVTDLVGRAKMLDELSAKSRQHAAAKQAFRDTFDPTARMAAKKQTERMLQELNAVRARIDCPKRGINCSGTTSVQEVADDINRELMHALHTAKFFKDLRLSPVLSD